MSFRKLPLILAVFAAVSLASTCALALDRSKFIPTKEIKPGMMAVGKTVFHGTKIETFHLKIIGVLPKFFMGSDGILARVLDGPVVQRQAGIIMGMSGSPVYIDGRLAGAIAFSWTFPKEPIAGITPIEEMLASWKETAPKKPAPASYEYSLPTPIKVGSRQIRRLFVHRTMWSARPQVVLPDSAHLFPAGGLLLASGFGERSLKKLQEAFEPYGTVVLQGGSPPVPPAAPPLEPGAAVGAELMSGDFTLAGIGTLTYREGNKILAFGHDMFGVGRVDFPLVSAYILDIFPSYFGSFKLESTTKRAGRISLDRYWAISGEVGAKPDTIPVTLTVKDRADGHKRSFQVEVARHRLFSPDLIRLAALSAIDRTWGYSEQGTALVSLDMRAKGRPPIRRTELVSSSSDAALAAATQVLRPLGTFVDNELGSLDLERVQVSIELDPAQKTARIERLSAKQQKLKAGETLELEATLRLRGGKQVSKSVKVDIPSDTPSGTLRIAACGGADAEQARAMLGIARPLPQSMEDVVDQYVSRERTDEIVLQLGMPTRGIRVNNEVLPSLPGGLADVLLSAGSTTIRAQPDVIKTVLPTDWVVSGRQLLTVTVEGKPGAGPAAPPPPPRPEERPGVAPPESGEVGPEGSDDSEERELSASTLDWREAAARLAAQAEAPGPPAPQPPGSERPKKEEQAKPVGRAVSEWAHHAKADFQPGKFKDTALDSRGRILLSRPVKVFAELTDSFPLALLPAGERLFAGTCPCGVIYELTADGKAKEFFKTGEVAVHCLASDRDGNIYAGTSPSGKVFKINAKGEGKVIFDSPATYIWCLRVAPDGSILAGSGSPGRVYKISPEGAATQLLDLAGTHVLSLLLNADSSVLAGTSHAGVLYRIRSSGQAEAIFDAAEASLTALASDATGNIYAATSPKGYVYKIDDKGGAKKIFDAGQSHILALIEGPEDTLYASTAPDGLVFKINPADETAQLLIKPEQGQAVSLARSGDGSLFVGYANPGLVRKLEPGYAASGTYESAALDAGRPARWGTIRWQARAASGTEVVVQTRSGNTADPDDRWSDWSPPYQTADGEGLASPRGRFIQYRLTLKSTRPEATPTVEQVQITYLPQNQPPKVEIQAPAAGAHASKKVQVNWKGQDPDKDRLVFDIMMSQDQGATWQPVKKDIAKAPFDWDVSKLTDGPYLLKVVASDREAIPWDPAQSEEERLIWVDNTAPTALVYRHTVKVSEQREATMDGIAVDKTSGVRGVDYRLDEGEWKSALPANGIFEGQQTDFSIRIADLSPGRHSVEVRAFDEAGNLGSDKVRVEVGKKEVGKKEERGAKKPEPQ
jgi:hypothetical protein